LLEGFEKVPQWRASTIGALKFGREINGIGVVLRGKRKVPP